MAKIICKINLGVLYQDIFIEDQNKIEKFSIPLNEIPNFIVKQREIKDIYIKTPNKDFFKNIELKTKKLEYNLYTQNTKYFHYI